MIALLLALAAATPTTDEAAVIATENEWCTAYLKYDTAALDRILLDDYTLTNSKGHVSTKADDIAEVKKQDPKYSVFRNDDMKARVHGDTAVVTGITTVVGVSEGTAFTAHFQFTDTFARVQGKWRALAGHVTKMPEATK